MPVIVGALGSFLVLLALLSVQMRAGEDPALGPTAAAAPPRKTVLERRIIEKRVIITDAPRVVASPSPSGSAAVASRAVPAPAPAAQAPSAAPVQAAPAPAPPPPAPVTRTS